MNAAQKLADKQLARREQSEARDKERAAAHAEYLRKTTAAQRRNDAAFDEYLETVSHSA